MIIGIDHLLIAMPKHQEAMARAFYGQVLELPEIPKPQALRARGGVWFALPHGQELHLGIEEPFAPAKKAHPCFVVADIDDLARNLEQLDYPVHWDQNVPDVRRFFTLDPFGNRLEFQGQDG